MPSTGMVAARFLPVRENYQQGPHARPPSVILGSTSNVRHVRGSPRSDALAGFGYGSFDLRQFVTPQGTSQQRYVTTKLPGDFDRYQRGH